uniref:Uncharacterized protein n=1 Tax=Octopus bimaculoides TaxID=37653 RepID=A0A0L8GL55_OCTBM
MASGSVSSMGSYAKATAVRKPVPLETKLIKLDMEELTEEEIEECLGEIVNEAMYIGRGRKFGTVEVRFATIEEATKHATNILRSTKIALLPSYRGRRSVRIRIPRVPPEIKPEWLVATVLAETKEDPELGPVAETKPQQEKAQAEEENIVDHTEEMKERQKCETEETKKKNENGATNHKKRKKNKSKERSTENIKEIEKPEINNVQEEEERTDKDVKYKGVLMVVTVTMDEVVMNKGEEEIHPPPDKRVEEVRLESSKEKTQERPREEQEEDEWILEKEEE